MDIDILASLNAMKKQDERKNKMKKKHAEEQKVLYELKKQQIQDNLNQIKIYEKEIKAMEIERNEEDMETEKQFKQEAKISFK